MASSEIIVGFVWGMKRNAGNPAMLKRGLAISSLTAAILGAAPSRTGNPGSDGLGQTWTSPDERSSVVWERTTPGSEQSEPYSLVLERPCKAAYDLVQFSRRARVAWSPDSSHIAVSYVGPGKLQSFMATLDADGAVHRDDVRPTSHEWSAISYAPTLWGEWRDESHVSLVVFSEATSNPRPGCVSFFEYDTKTQHLHYVGPSCGGGLKLTGIGAGPLIQTKSKMKTDDRCH
jgi:hypothetical protein